MKIFYYSETEIEYLKSRDKKLGAAIDSVGRIEREITPDLFTALAKSIVSQHISAKAAVTVWRRFCARFEEITPDAIGQVAIGDLQQCGLPFAKAQAIKRISDLLLRGELDFAKIKTLPDREIIKILSALPGIGIWTAEMLLIFSLCRPDVVSFGDLAVRRGMMKLYGLNNLSREQFARYRKRYSPFGSVASLYLWALAAR